jgi:predicted PurR-regulated permease PerM
MTDPLSSAAALPGADGNARPPERVVSFRLRSILSVLGLALAVLAAVGFVVIAQHALTLIAISLFFALALNPGVAFFERRGRSRGVAVAAVYALAVAAVALMGLVLIPPLVTEVTRFVHGLPGLVTDITRGRGELGHLAHSLKLTERLQKLTAGSGGLAGAAHPVLSFASGVIGTVVGVIVVAFLTLFMLIEGGRWREQLLEIVPALTRPRWQRIGNGIYTAVGGFVTGNLLASLLAGIVVLIILLVAGLPYAVPIALLCALLELVPYVGPAVVTVVVGLVGLTDSVGATAVIIGVLLVYHAVEGHTIRPLIYGRALKLSALAVLMAILIGIEAAGILGALVAIPAAGAIQVVLREVIAEREEGRSGAITPPGL